MKRCTRCKIWKDRDKFGKRSGRVDGLNSWCKKCNSLHGSKYYAKNKDKVRDQTLRRLYGIDTTTYEKMFVAQNGCCAICDKHQLQCASALHTDHEHVIGFVRGLLCENCNTQTGLYELGKLSKSSPKYAAIERYVLNEGCDYLQDWND
jgi:hypothetical protein